MAFKYLVINSMELILFAKHIPHSEMLDRVKTRDRDRCTGAGFVSPSWEIYGESESLGIGRGMTDLTLFKVALKGIK